MRKNISGQVVSAHLVSKTDGSDVTSGTTTVYVTGDGGSQTSEGTATHEGNGLWSFSPSQANTNYDHIAFTFVNSSAISATVQVYTRHDANVTLIEGADPSDTIRDAVVDDATRIDASALNTATGTTIPAILDDTDLIDDGTSGLAKIATDVAAILVDTGTTLDGKINTIDTVVDGIKSVTDELPDAGALTSLATAANLATVAGYLDTEIAAILADTNELQTDWADGGRLDLILDARASQSSVDTIDGNVDAILLDTAEIGAAGAGLTAIPWNASWDAEVQSECNDALVANNLDHLLLSAVDTNFATTVHLDSVIGHLVDGGTTATFDRTTDSLEALRDRGDAAWITATSVTVSDKTGFALASDGLDAVTAWTVDVTGDITGNLSGSVGSVTGAVGSVTGNVGGNVTGSVGSVATGGIAAASFAAGAITATVIATNAIDADALAADAIAEINATVDTAISDAALATAAALATVDNVVDAIKAVTDNLPDSGALTSIATASALATVDSNVDDILEDTSTTIPSTLATIAGYIDTEITAIDSVVDAIKVTTDKLDDTLEDDAGTYRFTTNALEQAPSGGEGGTADWTADEKTAIRSILGIPASGTTPDDPTAGILDTIRDAVAVVDGNVDSILADTGTDGVIVASFTTAAKAELQAEAADALTSYDPPTKAELDSGLAALNDLDAAGIRTAVGLASANLDTQLSTIDTVVDSILDDTGTSGVVVSTFTTAGKAEIQQEAADALTAYDPPTNAELEARTLAAASYATAANQTTIAAYLDTEVAAILAAVDTEVAAIKAKTDNLPASPAATGDIPTASAIATAVFTTAMTESYAAQGDEFTLAQFSYIVHQSLFDSSRAGTTWTVKKLDQSTTAATATYDSAENPTGASRAT